MDKTILKLIFKKIGIITRYWVDSAQDRDYWRAFVDAALNPRLHNPGSSLARLSCENQN